MGNVWGNAHLFVCLFFFFVLFFVWELFWLAPCLITRHTSSRSYPHLIGQSSTLLCLLFFIKRSWCPCAKTHTYIYTATHSQNLQQFSAIKRNAPLSFSHPTFQSHTQLIATHTYIHTHTHHYIYNLGKTQASSSISKQECQPEKKKRRPSSPSATGKSLPTKAQANLIFTTPPLRRHNGKSLPTLREMRK